MNVLLSKLKRWKDVLPVPRKRHNDEIAALNTAWESDFNRLKVTTRNERNKIIADERKVIGEFVKRCMEVQVVERDHHDPQWEIRCIIDIRSLRHAACGYERVVEYEAHEIAQQIADAIRYGADLR